MKRSTKSTKNAKETASAAQKNGSSIFARMKATMFTSELASKKFLLILTTVIIFFYFSYDDYQDPQLSSITEFNEEFPGSFQKHQSMLDKILARLSRKKVDLTQSDEEFYPKVPPNPGIMDPGSTSIYLEQDDIVRVDKIIRSFIDHYNVTNIAHFSCSRNETVMMLSDEVFSSKLMYYCYSFSQHKTFYVKKLFFYRKNIIPSVYVLGVSKILGSDLVLLYDSLESLPPDLAQQFIDAIIESEATWLITTNYIRTINPAGDEEKIFFPYNLNLFPFYMDYFVLRYPRIISSKTSMFRGKELLVYRVRDLRENFPKRKREESTSKTTGEGALLDAANAEN